jgi:hypothetical protein
MTEEDISLPCKVRPDLGPTQLSVRWVPGPPSLGVKRPGHEADYSAPSNVEWIYTADFHTFSRRNK